MSVVVLWLFVSVVCCDVMLTRCSGARCLNSSNDTNGTSWYNVLVFGNNHRLGYKIMVNIITKARGGGRYFGLLHVAAASNLVQEVFPLVENVLVAEVDGRHGVFLFYEVVLEVALLLGHVTVEALEAREEGGAGHGAFSEPAGELFVLWLEVQVEVDDVIRSLKQTSFRMHASWFCVGFLSCRLF